MTQTAETRRAQLDLQDAIEKALKPVVVWSQTDDGEWIDSGFADEKTAAHYEAMMSRRGVATKREA